MNTATIQIVRVEPAELVAPVGVWFEATGLQGFNVREPSTAEIYDPTVHNISYFWDFDDPGSFTAPVNIPSAWNNKGVDYSKKAYHVFDNPGTYTVRLWAIDNLGVTAERTISLNVADPDQFYSRSRTICVSNQGDFTGAPAGAQFATSISNALGALQSLGQSGRILLRRGETFRESNSLGNGLTSLRIGDFGTGARPVLSPPDANAGEEGGRVVFGYRNGNIIADAVFYNLDFQGDWDAAKETGDGRQIAVGYGVHNKTSFNNAFYRCRVNGFSDFSPSNDRAGYTVGLFDCEITNWRVIGSFLVARPNDDNFRFAYVGTALHAKENACKNGRGDTGTPLDNIYGALRYGNIKNFVCSASSFFTASTPRGALQPCLRMAQNNSDVAVLPADMTHNIYANRCTIEGGAVVLGVDGQNGDADEMPGNHIFDMMLFLGGYDTYEWAAIAYGGSTVRNSIFWNPPLTRAPGERAPKSFLALDVENPINSNADAPMILTHNTFLNAQGGGEIPLVLNSQNFNTLDMMNNVNHQPNAGVTSDAPIDLSQSIAGVRPLNRGIRTGPARPSTTVSVIRNGGTFTVSYPVGLGQADFSPSGRHTVRVNNGLWFSHLGHCSLSFNASEITVTNTSGVTMSGNVQVALDQDTLTTNGAYSTPLMVPLPVPQGGSPALDDNGGAYTYRQFDTAKRIRSNGAV